MSRRRLANHFHLAGQIPLSPDSVEIPAVEVAKFNARIVRSDPDGCWTLLATTIRWKARDPKNYSTMAWRDEHGRLHHIRAHRLALIQAYGPIATDMLGCHTCNNPRCVRADPAHVRVDDNSGNQHDRWCAERARRAAAAPAPGRPRPARMCVEVRPG